MPQDKRDTFPQPTRFGPKSARWRLSDIERWENGTTECTVETERWLSVSQLAERFDVTKVCIWGWTRKARGYAKPNPAPRKEAAA